MFDTATAILDLLGVVVFATTGALVASRKEMDIVGFALLALATGVGGGTLRDLILDVPVFWVTSPSYLLICIAVAIVVFFTAHVPQSRYRLVLWLDAAGLALFAVAGTEKALLAGTGPVVAVALGIIGATFGGIIRDVLGHEPSVILTREIYVTAALAGAVAFALLDAAGLSREGAVLAAVALGFAVRGAALYWGLSLPRYRSRPGTKV
ncbi:trimeric intracellular cation channel family protein [Faunimonas sp. B44]|uniref:trimeric intracellular cation channel family protein n=1 Tax=Faunimonas sp. B44 TaxID=3461493 RepID=UPI004044AC7A